MHLLDIAYSTVENELPAETGRSSAPTPVRHLIIDLMALFSAVQAGGAKDSVCPDTESGSAPISATASLGFAHAQGFEKSATGMKTGADFMMHDATIKPAQSEKDPSSDAGAAAVKGDSPSSLSARDTERAAGDSAGGADVVSDYAAAASGKVGGIESHTFLSAAPAPRRLNLLKVSGLGAPEAGGMRCPRSATQTPRDDDDMSLEATSISKHHDASRSLASRPAGKLPPSSTLGTTGRPASGDTSMLSPALVHGSWGVHDVNFLLAQGLSLPKIPSPSLSGPPSPERNEFRHQRESAPLFLAGLSTVIRRLPRPSSRRALGELVWGALQPQPQPRNLILGSLAI